MSWKKYQRDRNVFTMKDPNDWAARTLIRFVKNLNTSCTIFLSLELPIDNYHSHLVQAQHRSRWTLLLCHSVCDCVHHFLRLVTPQKRSSKGTVTMLFRPGVGFVSSLYTAIVLIVEKNGMWKCLR